MTRLFCTVDVPPRHRANPINRHGPWYSWSPAWRDLLKHFRTQHVRRRPQVIEVPRCAPYPHTYHLDLDEQIGGEWEALFASAAEELLSLKLNESVILLTGLLEKDTDGEVLRSVFALLRAALVTIAGHPQAALYSPVQVERKRDNQFRLHSDLFLVDKLLLVFDQVSVDGTGRSLFLPYSKLDEILGNLDVVPNRVHAAVRWLLTGPRHKDGFNRLYDILHSEQHPWTRALEQQMRQHQLTVAFSTGEGYLLNDRRWLHGREGVSGVVGSRRFHRLIIGDSA